MSRAVDATNGRLPGWPAWRRLTAVRRLARRTGLVGSRAGGVRRVTVVQSDIVSSTHLLEAAGPDYPRLLMRHRSLIAAAVARRGGRFLSHAGDGTLAVFERAGGALLASVEAQRALAAEPWPEDLVPRVRMGVHAGDVFEIDGEPVGLVINHGARIMSAAQPGQVMVSAAAAEAAMHDGPPRVGLSVVDAGWHTLRDHAGPVRLRQVVAAGLTVVPPDSGQTIDLTVGADRAADVAALLEGVA
jgi:class 3 adenylate cyclase